MYKPAHGTFSEQRASGSRTRNYSVDVEILRWVRTAHLGVLLADTVSEVTSQRTGINLEKGYTWVL